MKTNSTATIPQHPYFNVNSAPRTREFLETHTNLYSTLITKSKVYDVAVLKQDKSLKNSTGFIREVASYEL